MAVEVLHEACRVLDWGLAQVITLLAPETGVVGGGVSLIGETCFLRPLRREIARYVFPPLADSYEVVPPNSENSSSSTEPWRWRRWLRTSNVQRPTSNRPTSNRPTVQPSNMRTAPPGRKLEG